MVSILPEILKSKIKYFFKHYKDLQPNAWSNVKNWVDKDDAERIIMESIDRYWTHKRNDA